MLPSIFLSVVLTANVHSALLLFLVFFFLFWKMPICKLVLSLIWYWNIRKSAYWKYRYCTGTSTLVYLYCTSSTPVQYIILLQYTLLHWLLRIWWKHILYFCFAKYFCVSKNNIRIYFSRATTVRHTFDSPSLHANCKDYMNLQKTTQQICCEPFRPIIVAQLRLHLAVTLHNHPAPCNSTVQYNAVQCWS